MNPKKATISRYRIAPSFRLSPSQLHLSPGDPAPAAVQKARFWGHVPRGVSNRNVGLAWLRKYASDGVAYFADDDNTYDIRLFTELLKTRRVSVFPVGMVTEFGHSPVVQEGRVVAFYGG